MSLAIVDWKHPELSVFSTKASPFPLPDLAGKIPEILELAQITLQNRPVPNNTVTPSAVQRRQDTPAPTSSTPSTASSAAAVNANLNIPAQSIPSLPQGAPLLADLAAGDPPSLGIAIILASKAAGSEQIKNINYNDAAQSQVNFNLYHVPRNVTGESAGAISHREKTVQLWADNVHMVPPFFAYYGVVTNNATLVQEAYNQIKTYRAALQDPSTNLWRHMTPGTEANDPHFWATGNAWAAMGMLRVLATIDRSQFKDDMAAQRSDLQAWAAEILSATRNVPRIDDLIHNYMDNSASFPDATATALLSAAGLRMSTMNLTNEYVDMSTTLLGAVSKQVNETGFLKNVTDPYSFSKPGNYSGEGQSFVLMAYAAFRDWEAMGKPGNSRGDDPLGGKSGALRCAPAVGALVLALGAYLVV